MADITLIADSGSTKTDWLLLDNETGKQRTFKTQGINPFMLSEEQIKEIIQCELLNENDFLPPKEIRFYGAGCRGKQCDILRSVLAQLFSLTTSHIVVDSDLVGAAKALCGDADGIACILGTGSNSCLYQNGKIVSNVSPLGYILGDEGSGAVLGRRLIGDVLKHQLPLHLCQDFEEQYHLSSDDMITRVYKQPFANRFLASFVPFLHRHKEELVIRDLLIEEFSRFFQRNIRQYNRPDLPVSFVGSVAYYFQDELEVAAIQCGFTLGRVLKNPLEGMART